MKVYFGDWSESAEVWDSYDQATRTPIYKTQNGKEQVATSFNKELGEDVDILFAWYVYENYSGSAFVLFRQGGNLYEVNGSHCSCHGLEGQWEPEEVSVEELRKRATEKYHSDWDEGYRWPYGDGFGSEERQALLEALNGVGAVDTAAA